MGERQDRTTKDRIEAVLADCGEEARKVLLELFAETERLKAENTRLRQALVKTASGTAGMSSRLKDALYE